eukprot:237560-Amphidinium_carterae.1
MAMRRFVPLSEDEVDALAAYMTSTRNRFTSRSGYSPVQRVFGVQQPLAESLLADQPSHSMIWEGPLES